MRSYLPPSRSMEILAIKLLALWGSLIWGFPRNFHSRVSSDHSGSLESAWLRGDRHRPQYVRRKKSLGPLLKNHIPSHQSSTKNTSASDDIAASKHKSPHKAMRATHPETDRRVEDMHNRQDQKPKVALFLFLRHSSSKNYCASRIGLLS